MSLEAVQRKLGVPTTGTWDSTTDGAMLAYQQSGAGKYPMASHGHPDPATLVNLGYYRPDEVLREPWVDYLAGDGKPSTFMRDVGTAIDQVPRWAWVATAAAFSVFAYLSYRGSREAE